MCEIDPLDCLNSLKSQKILEVINKDYITKRNQILEHIKLLVEKFELSRHIYYLTVFLIDQIKTQHQGLPSEYVSIGCLLLASNLFLISS
jgi:hypothetical protein